MKKRILVTGGAGFIGTNLVRKLLEFEENHVIILDNYSEKIHGSLQNNSNSLKHKRLKIIKDSLINVDQHKNELCNCDYIVHLAAETGTGQSMYDIDNYFHTNITGTNKLLKFIQDNDISLKNFILASSRSVYGEGEYLSIDEKVHKFVKRDTANLRKGIYEPIDTSGNTLKCLPVTETTPKDPISYYALTKSVQEDLVTYFCNLSKINYSILRLQNVYGPGQSLINPYTGVLGVFSNLARQNKEINVFEDGLMTRDFVFVDDVVKIICILLDKNNHKQKDKTIFNIGSGKKISILEVAKKIKIFFNSSSDIKISGNFRIGDIRHNFINLKELKANLGDMKFVSFDEGLNKFLNWALETEPLTENFFKSLEEMKDSNFLIDE
tara:strand:+ start:4096 stop:5241 length:1146 start_codon:yes stop_codon:yes gene_type:complete